MKRFLGTVFLATIILVGLVATLEAREAANEATASAVPVIDTMGAAPAVFFFDCGECNTDEIRCGPPGGIIPKGVRMADPSCYLLASSLCRPR